MKIAIGSDHGGFELKKEVISYLKNSGYEVVDFGTNTSDSCDYPDFGVAVAEAVAQGECERGIVACTTGIGISIAANKVLGIRCALCLEPHAAELARLHNDANVLALSGLFTNVVSALEIVRVFLATPFSNEERHQRRLNKIAAIERKYGK